MNPDELEKAAKKARRLADIAKHTPIPESELDAFGDDISQRTCAAQVDLMGLACTLQNAYAAEMNALWSTIRRLRCGAMYWRERCRELEMIERERQLANRCA